MAVLVPATTRQTKLTPTTLFTLMSTKLLLWIVFTVLLATVNCTKKAKLIAEKKLELQQEYFRDKLVLSSRIIGGEDAPNARYGYMATLLLNGRFFLGGH